VGLQDRLGLGRRLIWRGGVGQRAEGQSRHGGQNGAQPPAAAPIDWLIGPRHHLLPRFGPLRAAGTITIRTGRAYGRGAAGAMPPFGAWHRVWCLAPKEPARHRCGGLGSPTYRDDNCKMAQKAMLPRDLLRRRVLIKSGTRKAECGRGRVGQRLPCLLHGAGEQPGQPPGPRDHNFDYRGC
jgi:hypothetical protein